MSAFKFVVSATLALALTQPFTALGASLETDMYGPGANDDPTAARMMGDALIARPLYAAATATGVAIFVATLPFTALGGNVDESASQLVVGPARGLFTRCLGCVKTRQEMPVERPLE
ncbi:MAG TPA: hypothetical protein VHN38_09445 [Immundisolibacter sp.]|nr:hypothetical protein [Immundisolibacter sp.]